MELGCPIFARLAQTGVRITGSVMEPNDLIILTPTGLTDPALAIAACRAGARGVLNLEFAADAAAVGAAVDRLARFAPGGFGAALGPDGDRLLADTVRPAW